VRGAAPAALRTLALLALLALLSGCQLVDAPRDAAATAPAADDGREPALGSPVEDWPRTLTALRAVAEPEALAWQDDPVLADLTVWLDEQQRWERVRLTYVAPDAERMLTYRSRPDELRLERPRLAGLQLPVLPAAAVDAIAPFPEAAMEPADLAAAAAAALADCEAAGPARAVLYATGAPAAWDGTAWTRNPTWRATVVTGAGGVVVDATTGQAFAPLTCVAPLLLDAS
jgi:hypothetical protein